MGKDFIEAVRDRRTFYSLSKDGVIEDKEIEEVIAQAVKHAPTAFNSQSGRVVLLLGKHHDKLWEIAKGCLRKIIPEDKFESTENKINSFKNGYGTALFFEDTNVIQSLQQQYELYKDNFPIWAQQANGMLQFIIWTALEGEGLGVSLQHYSEIIEAEVKAEWGIAKEWKLIAQMPFGKPVDQPGTKQIQSLEDRVKVFKN